jgi:hypothetical protein
MQKLSAGKFHLGHSLSRQPLFDHFIGTREQGRGHGEAQRLRRDQVDDEIELARLLDRKIGWFCPSQDFVRISAVRRNRSGKLGP